MKITPAFVVMSLAFTNALAAPLSIDLGPHTNLDAAPIDINGEKYYSEGTFLDSKHKANLVNLDKHGINLNLGDKDKNSNILSMDEDGHLNILRERDNPGSIVDGIPIVGPIASALLPPVASAVAGLPIVGGVVTGVTGVLGSLPVVGPLVKVIGNGLDLGPLVNAQKAIVQFNAEHSGDSPASPAALSAYLKAIQLQQVALQDAQQSAIQMQAAAQSAIPSAAASQTPVNNAKADTPAIQPILGSDGEYYYSAAALANYIDSQEAVNMADDIYTVASGVVSATPSATMAPRVNEAIESHASHAMSGSHLPNMAVFSEGTLSAASAMPTMPVANKAYLSADDPTTTETSMPDAQPTPHNVKQRTEALWQAERDVAMPSATPSVSDDPHQLDAFTVKRILAAMTSATETSSSLAATPTSSTSSTPKTMQMYDDDTEDDSEDDGDCDLDDCNADEDLATDNFIAHKATGQRDFTLFSKSIKRWLF